MNVVHSITPRVDCLGSHCDPCREGDVPVLVFDEPEATIDKLAGVVNMLTGSELRFAQSISSMVASMRDSVKAFEGSPEPKPLIVGRREWISDAPLAHLPPPGTLMMVESGGRLVPAKPDGRVLGLTLQANDELIPVVYRS